MPFALPERRVLFTDLRASLVVFLVALPLCLGVAVASGAPPVAGLITGIVGGLVIGVLPGSRLQVSGPTASLVVLVFGAIQAHGVAVLGAITIVAGLVQLVLAAARLGTWFRAMALPVVHGMLAGIGLLIIVQQLLVVFGSESRGDGPTDLAAIPGAAADAVAGPGGVDHALLAGLLGVAVLLVWRFAPRRIAWLPGQLVTVVAVTAVAAVVGWNAERIALPANLLDAVALPDAGTLELLADPSVLGVGVAIGLVASAESLLSAIAVDRMQTGERTRYNAELGSQGVGNAVAGVLGGLPLAAVVVRSGVNVDAGAETKVSRVAHGAWLLAFAALLPGLLSQIPIAALAAILVMAGVALVKPADVRRLAAEGRGELLTYAVTVVVVFAFGLLPGVVAGLALAALLLLRELSGVRVERHEEGVDVSGPATFLGVPRLAEELEAVPAGTDVRVSLDAATMVDPAAADLLEGWRARHESTGATVAVTGHERFAEPAEDGEPEPAR